MSDPPGQRDSDPAHLKIGIDHAWAWFALHADQRLRMVNFFLLASAFLGTAYLTNLERMPMLALAAALAGLLVTIAFGRLEVRTRQLVKIGESALSQLERQLGELTGVDELELVKRSERAPTLASYAKILGLLNYVSITAFLLAVVVALIRLAG